ncbi:MAG TPA: type II toxin-antitoxin system VapC family toxin [Nitrospiria bacterium]|nr:type II toxin-antitoxin system VapC family toxin [Nitrospiria bacterium]
MKKVLVDTDILIDFLRGKESARDYLRGKLQEAILCCSVIAVAEIYAGMLEKEREKTLALLDGLFILPVTLEIAEIAGRFKRSVKSHALELDDCLIAATAFVEQAVLATRNRKHYPMKEVEIEAP